MNKKRLSGLLILLVLLGTVFVNGCKKNQDVNTPEVKVQQDDIYQKIKKTVTYVFSTTKEFSLKFYEIVRRLAEDEPDKSGYYDPYTGWWTLSFDFRGNQRADVRAQLLDDRGKFHQYYDTNITDTVIAEGKGEGKESGPDGIVYFNLTFTQAKAEYSVLLMNGDGSGSYQWTDSARAYFDFTHEDVTYIKDKEREEEGNYPQSGVIQINIEGIMVTITFNGTNLVEAKYSYQGITYTITIDMKTIKIPGTYNLKD